MSFSSSSRSSSPNSSESPANLLMIQHDETPTSPIPTTTTTTITSSGTTTTTVTGLNTATAAATLQDLLGLPVRYQIQRGRTLRILIVDDSSVNRQAARRVIVATLKRLFPDVNCSIDQASDGNEAICAAQRNAYDLVFMDIHMPNCDGIDATLQIKSSCNSTPVASENNSPIDPREQPSDNPLYQRQRRFSEGSPQTPIRIFGWTSDHSQTTIEKCHGCGMEKDILNKPLDETQLHDVFKNCFVLADDDATNAVSDDSEDQKVPQSTIRHSHATLHSHDKL